MFVRRSLQQLKTCRRYPGPVLHHARGKPVIRCRPASTSSATPGSTERLAQQFQSRIWDCISSSQRSGHGIREAYTSLRSIIDVSNAEDVEEVRKVIAEGDIVDVLALLATSENVEDQRLIPDFLADVPVVFGHLVTSELHLAVLQDLSKRGQTMALWNWIRNMDSFPGGVKPSYEHWDLLLEQCVEQQNVDLMWKAIGRMSPNCSPTHDTFTFLLRAIFQTQKDHFGQVLQAIDAMRRLRLPPDAALGALIQSGLEDKGRIKQAVRAAELYSVRLAPFAPTLPPSIDETRNNDLARAFIEHGRHRTVQLYQKFVKDNFAASDDTFIAILVDSCNAGDLIYLEKEFGVKAGPRVWSILLRNALVSRTVGAALAIYEDAKAAGYAGVYDLVQPLVRALCSPNQIRPTDDAFICKALDLYREYLSTLPNKRNTKKRKTLTRSAGPRVVISNSILRALVSSPNKTKHFPVAVELLTELMVDNADIDSMTMTSIVVLMMKSSSSFSEAYRAYELVRCHRRPPLDKVGFSTVIHTFAELQFDSRTIPPWTEYFNMVQDMREAGNSITPEVYTSILRQISKVASHTTLSDAAGSDAFRQFTTTVRDLHHALSLDPTVTPDTALLNQLMDTYQRVGCYEDAHKIWNSLYHAGRVSDASVSIIFDACGRSKALGTAKQIFRQLKEDGFVMNMHHWQSWLECLCRMGELDEATRTVCVEMGKDDTPAPDEDCVRILMKFARREKLVGEVRARIQQYSPGVWKKFGRVHYDEQ